MKIIIVGCGKVGYTLAEQLDKEGHDVTLIEKDADKLQEALSVLDIQGIVGNGTSYKVQMEADIKNTDLLIAVADRDETNLLSCLIAKKAGNCCTIARVRNPEYYEEIGFIKEELGLSMAINPELAAASEIARLIQVPSAMEIDTFAKGRVNLLKFRIPANSCLCGLKLSEFSYQATHKTLICIIERNHEVIIPDGNTVLQENDLASLIIPPENITSFFSKIGIRFKSIHNVIIAGGGTIAYYLAKRLIRSHIRPKILEASRERCEVLSELLPEAMIINGDASDQRLLQEEGIDSADAFVCLTNFDEENILLALYANRISGAKLITKINKISFEELTSDIPIGSIICPKHITSEMIIQYVRSLQNSFGNNIEALYRLTNNQVEALEFQIKEDSPITNRPLSTLNLKPNLLICCIWRKHTIITPSGKDMLKAGDSVIVVTTNKRLKDIQDIFRS